jgi:hypothetical protein
VGSAGEVGELRLERVELGPSHQDGRDHWTPQARRAEVLRWRTLLAEPGGRGRFDHEVRRALVEEGTWHLLAADERAGRLAEAEETLTETAGHLGKAEARLAETEARLAAAEGRLAAAEGRLAAVTETRTWRWRSAALRRTPVRHLAEATRRDRTTPPPP